MSVGSRRRLNGTLGVTPRGLALRTESGDLWVLDFGQAELSQPAGDVVVEGTQMSLDRIRVDWLGVDGENSVKTTL